MRLLPAAALFLGDGLGVGAAGVIGHIDRGQTLVLVAVALVTLHVRGHHRMRLSPSIADDLRPVMASVAVGVLAFAAVSGPWAPTRLITTWLVTGALLMCVRWIAYASGKALHRRGLGLAPTLVIGAGDVGQELARILIEHPETGLKPVGLIDGFPYEAGMPVPVLGDVKQLGQVVSAHQVSHVIIAFGALRDLDMVKILRACGYLQLTTFVIPRFFDLGMELQGPGLEELRGLPLVRMRPGALRTRTWPLKRFLDVVVAGTGLVLTAPLWAVLALLVKASSPGPVFFSQERVGRDGQPITVRKFRSMKVNDDSDHKWSVQGDAKVTPVGRFLRSSGLDELPQLLNVLAGDMSIVGPRPERPLFAAEFGSWISGYEDRLRVPPGITGWAQVAGLRGDTSIPRRTRLDNSYIENWSLWRDLVIMARTVPTLLRRQEPGSVASPDEPPPAVRSSTGGLRARIGQNQAEAS